MKERILLLELQLRQQKSRPEREHSLIYSRPESVPKPLQEIPGCEVQSQGYLSTARDGPKSKAKQRKMQIPEPVYTSSLKANS